MKRGLSSKKVMVALLLLVALAALAGILWISFGHRSAASYMDEARIAYENGNYDGAEGALKHLLRLDRNNEAAYRMLAEMAERRRHWAEAAAYWSVAGSLNPLDPALKLKLYLALDRAGMFQSMVGGLEALALKEKLPPELELLRAKANLRIGRLEEAGKLIDALSYSQDDPKVEILEADLLLANGKREEADRIYRHLASASDDRIRCQAGLGMVVCDIAAGRLDRAGAKLSLIKSAPGCEADIYLVRAELATAEGKLPEAASALESLLKLHRANPMVSVRLAEVYAALKDKAKLEKLANSGRGNGREMAIAASYASGLAAALNQNYAKAVELLRLAPELSGRIPAQAIFMQEAVIRGDLNQALDAADKLLAARHDDAAKQNIEEVLTPMLAAMESQGRNADVRRLSRFLLDLRPGQKGILLAIMRAELGDGDFLSALKTAESLLKLAPDDEEAWQGVIRAGLESRSYGECLKWCAKRLEKRPDDVFAMLSMARAYAATGKIQEAGTIYDRLLKLDKFTPQIGQEAGFFFLMTRQNGKFDAVVEKLSASKDVTTQAIAWELKGARALATDKRDEAETAFREALKLAPEQQGYYVVLSTLLLQKRDLPGAIACLDAAVAKLKNCPPSIRYRLAVALKLTMKPENFVRAMEIFHDLLKADPKNVDCMVDISDILSVDGKHKAEALEWAEKAYRLNPQNPEVQFCYADRLNDIGRYREAVPVFQRLLQRNHRTADVTKCLELSLRGWGRELQNAKDWARAAETWRELLKLTPKDAEAEKALKTAVQQLDAAKE